MSQAKNGDTVRVHYTGKLKDGKIFDSSREREPLQLTLGAGQVIPGFEQALEGMAPGESKSIEIMATEAFGQRQQALILDFERSALPADAEPQVGQRMQLETQDGRPVPAVVTSVSASTVRLDANHPLAGRDLILDLELFDII